jgi:hypothetical protein
MIEAIVALVWLSVIIWLASKREPECVSLKPKRTYPCDDRDCHICHARTTTTDH